LNLYFERDARKIFDTSANDYSIGCIMVSYGKVESKVNLKYDSLHKDTLNKFGSILNNTMREYHSKLLTIRSELETSPNLDELGSGGLSMHSAIVHLKKVQLYKNNVTKWIEQNVSFKNGEKMLKRQRYQFTTSWLHSDHVESELASFQIILDRKNSKIQSQLSTLKMKIKVEEEKLNLKFQNLKEEWRLEEEAAPVEPNLAIKRLDSIALKLTQIKAEQNDIEEAKDTLNIPKTTTFSSQSLWLDDVDKEINNLKKIWFEMKNIIEELNELRQHQWLSVQPKKIRSILEDLSTRTKQSVPIEMQKYEIYQQISLNLKTIIKNHQILTDLRSEVLKERHWSLLMKQMNVHWNLNDLNLGQLWDIDLIKYEKIIKDILVQAQGENGLGEYLKQVDELMQTLTIELISFQNKTKVIKGWDDLFNNLKENIQSLTAMRQSPYYKQFESEASNWEDRLNKICNIFDVWIDVQRRWVYLDGIFGSSADIKHILPNESQQFQVVSNEFLNLMKKVTKNPLVIEVLSIQGVQALLERLADLLTKIQKALGEYLEKQRSSFPRFYFVGDEDLLEIIGNSKNLPKLQKHFKKMFAGVNSLLLNETNNIIIGLQSRDNETVIFKKDITVTENSKINEWLTNVEKEMKQTLAKLLAESINEFNEKNFQNEVKNIEKADEFNQWLDKYQAQLIVLTAQVNWCKEIDNALETIQINDNNSMVPLKNVLQSIESVLKVLADSVVNDQPLLRRKKLEHLVIK
jgi:dynein heavy chain 1, cytosolic